MQKIQELSIQELAFLGFIHSVITYTEYYRYIMIDLPSNPVVTVSRCSGQSCARRSVRNDASSELRRSNGCWSPWWWAATGMHRIHLGRRIAQLCRHIHLPLHILKAHRTVENLGWRLLLLFSGSRTHEQHGYPRASRVDLE